MNQAAAHHRIKIDDLQTSSFLKEKLNKIHTEYIRYISNECSKKSEIEPVWFPQNSCLINQKLRFLPRNALCTKYLSFSLVVLFNNSIYWLSHCCSIGGIYFCKIEYSNSTPTCIDEKPSRKFGYSLQQIVSTTTVWLWSLVHQVWSGKNWEYCIEQTKQRVIGALFDLY